MRHIPFLAVCAPLALACGPLPGLAQDSLRQLIDTLPGQVGAACAETAVACDDAVAEALAQLDASGLTGADRASVVAAVAGAVVSAAQNAGTELAGYAAPLERLRIATGDAGQAQAIGDLAAAFARGNPDEIATLDPVAASPN